MTFGHKGGAGFVSLSVELNPDEPIVGNAVEISGLNLRVTGSGDVPQEVETFHTTRSILRGPEGMIEARPTLAYSVFERQPESRSRSSSSGDEKQTRIVWSLPRKKIRISGTMEIRRIAYRTVHRAPLDRPFEIKRNGLRVAFINSPGRLAEHENAVSWKAYRPPLLGSLSTSRWELVRFRLDDPASDKIDWYNHLQGSGGGGGAFFGPYHEYALRVSDREIESDYYWRQLKERGYNKSVREWKQEAELVCEVVDEVHPLILPVDIEVEVPDPVKVRELLLKGGL
jgi:hypothetical protein